MVIIRLRALTLTNNTDDREDTEVEVKRLKRLELEIHRFNPINQKSQTGERARDRALLDNNNYIYIISG